MTLVPSPPPTKNILVFITQFFAVFCQIHFGFFWRQTSFDPYRNRLIRKIKGGKGCFFFGTKKASTVAPLETVEPLGRGPWLSQPCESTGGGSGSPSQKPEQKKGQPIFHVKWLVYKGEPLGMGRSWSGAVFTSN